jgi:WD40 repeat protein
MINRTFRLFISSTFSDFIAEREALRTQVFPKLEFFCAERGARFQAVDLRWGITDEAQREHDTMRICLEEVRRCQELSPRPNFAVLLGDRYGWEPVPARIPVDHWTRLLAGATRADRAILRAGYQGPDRNAVPPAYHLRPREGDWAASEARESVLRDALRRAADAAGFAGVERLPYFASATHQEIALGALSGQDVPGHVRAYVRRLKGLHADATACDFIDWDAVQSRPVAGARERLHGLEQEVRAQIGAGVHELHARWSPAWRQGKADQDYLDAFCDRFLSDQMALIEAEIASQQRLDPSLERDRAHEAFGLKRSAVFEGRKRLLARIAGYTAGQVARSASTPLVLVGEGGSGKSALLARAARMDVGSPAQVFQRYIGGVPGTETAKALLMDLVVDLSRLYGQPEPASPEDFKALVAAFHQALTHARADRPLHLYLDALDQLDDVDGAWSLEWLPQTLPAHVQMVVSLRAGTQVERSARQLFKSALLHVPVMTPAEGRAMLDAWLSDKHAAWFNAGIVPSVGRRLTPLQKRHVLGAFNQGGSALWLKLAYEEASSWASWDAPRELPPTVEGMIEYLINTRLLERENHPKVFTEHALAYLAAARFGLSEDELAGVLGADPAVRDEFRGNEKSRVKWEDPGKLPPILWSRLYFDLQPYLGLAQVDGALLMRWFHREFGEVIARKYLATSEDRRSMHGALAHVFRGMERQLRSTQQTDDALFRSTDVGGQPVSVALRRIMEEPWQLAQAGKSEDLRALLSDFGFCMGKCAANRAEDFLADVKRGQAADAATIDSVQWSHFLDHHGFLLARGDRTWPDHKILLQLACEQADESVVTRSAEAWLERDLCDWTWMRKVSRPHLVDVGATVSVMGGHTAQIMEILLLPGGRAVSWALDRKIILWDLTRGRSIVSMTVLSTSDITSSYMGMRLLSDDTLLCWCDGDLEVWDLAQARRVATWQSPEGSIGGVSRATSTEVLVWWWSAQGVEQGASSQSQAGYVFGIWDLQSLTTSARRLDGARRIRKVQEVDADRVAVYIGQRAAYLVDKLTFKSALVIEHEDKLLGMACLDGHRIVSWSKDRTVKIWVTPTGELERTFLVPSTLAKVKVLDAHTLVGWCSTRGEGWPSTDSIFLVSMVEDDPAVMELVGHNSYVSDVVRLADGRLASASGDNTLRLWDVTGAQARPAGLLQGHAGEVDGVALVDDGLLISWSHDSTLRLWDPSKVRPDSKQESQRYIKHFAPLESGSVVIQTDVRSVVLPPRDDAPAIALEAAPGVPSSDLTPLKAGGLGGTSEDGKILIWDPDTGAIQREMDCADAIKGRSCMLDERRLVVCCEHTIQVWDVVQGQRLQVIPQPGVSQVFALTRGRGLSIGPQGLLRVFDLATAQPVCDLPPHTDPYVHVEILADRYLAVWDVTMQPIRSVVRLYDLATLALLREFVAPTVVGGVRCLPTGQVLCWGGDFVWVIEPASDAPPLALEVLTDDGEGSFAMIYDVIDLGGGRFVPHTGGRTIHIWDTNSTECLQVLEGHDGPVVRVTALPGDRLLSESRDRQMIIWDARSGRIIEKSEPSWLRGERLAPQWTERLFQANRLHALWLLPPEDDRQFILGLYQGKPFRWFTTAHIRSPLCASGDAIVMVSNYTHDRLGLWKGRHRLLLDPG